VTGQPIVQQAAPVSLTGTLDVKVNGFDGYRIAAVVSDVASLQITITNTENAVLGQRTVSTAQMAGGKGRITMADLPAGPAIAKVEAFAADGESLGETQETLEVLAGKTTLVVMNLKLKQTVKTNDKGNAAVNVSLTDGDETVLPIEPAAADPAFPELGSWSNQPVEFVTPDAFIPIGEFGDQPDGSRTFVPGSDVTITENETGGTLERWDLPQGPTWVYKPGPNPGKDKVEWKTIYLTKKSRTFEPTQTQTSTLDAPLDSSVPVSSPGWGILVHYFDQINLEWGVDYIGVAHGSPSERIGYSAGWSYEYRAMDPGLYINFDLTGYFPDFDGTGASTRTNRGTYYVPQGIKVLRIETVRHTNYWEDFLAEMAQRWGYQFRHKLFPSPGFGLWRVVGP
jgi:hypothetical protein